MRKTIDDEIVSSQLGELSDDWSRPRMVSRVFEALGEESPERLRAERFRALIVTLRDRGIEASFADDPSSRPLTPDVESPGILAKLRLRRATGAARRTGPIRRSNVEHLFGQYEVVQALVP